MRCSLNASDIRKSAKRLFEYSHDPKDPADEEKLEEYKDILQTPRLAYVHRVEEVSWVSRCFATFLVRVVAVAHTHKIVRSTLFSLKQDGRFSIHTLTTAVVAWNKETRVRRQYGCRTWAERAAWRLHVMTRHVFRSFRSGKPLVVTPPSILPEDSQDHEESALPPLLDSDDSLERAVQPTTDDSQDGAVESEDQLTECPDFVREALASSLEHVGSLVYGLRAH